MDDNHIAELARALGHPARVHIVRLLAGQSACRGTEVFSELPLAQSTISEHLRVLREAGVVQSHPEGTSMVYCLAEGAFDDLTALLDTVRASHAECAPPRHTPSCEGAC